MLHGLSTYLVRAVVGGVGDLVAGSRRHDRGIARQGRRVVDRVGTGGPGSTTADADYTTRHDEAAHMLTDLRPHLDDLVPQATVWCLVGLAASADMAGDIERALDLLEEAAAIPHEDDPVLHALATGWRWWRRRSWVVTTKPVRPTGEGSLTPNRRRTGPCGAYLFSKVGMWADNNDEYEIARQCHRDSAEHFRQTGDHGGLGYTLSRLSWTCRRMGDFDAALEYAEAGLEEFRQVNHRWGIGASMGRMADAHLDAGRTEVAACRFRECLDWGEQSAMPTIVCYGLAGISLTLAAVGDDERAAVLFAHSMSVAQNPYLSVVCRPGLADVGERLAPERLEAAVERGRSFEMTEAILFAA